MACQPWYVFSDWHRAQSCCFTCSRSTLLIRPKPKYSPLQFKRSLKPHEHGAQPSGTATGAKPPFSSEKPPTKKKRIRTIKRKNKKGKSTEGKERSRNFLKDQISLSLSLHSQCHFLCHLLSCTVAGPLYMASAARHSTMVDQLDHGECLKKPAALTIQKHGSTMTPL